MREILYIDKCPRPRDYSQRAFAEKQKKAVYDITKDIKKSIPDLQFIVDFNSFDLILEFLPNRPYAGLITHFPRGKFPPSSMEGKLERLSYMYSNSSKMLNQIRTQNPNLPILVYTGVCSGQEDDPTTSIMTKIITDSGADAIIFKGQPSEDAKKMTSILEGILK